MNDNKRNEIEVMNMLLDKENKSLRCYCEALEAYLGAILPEYEKYLAGDISLDDDSKRIRLFTVQKAKRTEKLNGFEIGLGKEYEPRVDDGSCITEQVKAIYGDTPEEIKKQISDLRGNNLVLQERMEKVIGERKQLLEAINAYCEKCHGRCEDCQLFSVNHLLEVFKGLGEVETK